MSSVFWSLTATGQIYQSDVTQPFLEARTIDVSLPVGVVAGSAGASASGAAQYSLPIYIPPGTNGVQPAVSIQYNSQGRDGVLGWGWSLVGSSSILRTGMDWYHDGLVPGPHGANYAPDDRFSIDGQRLVLTSNTGSYGEAGTKYDTEDASFSDYTAVGQLGAGPASFTTVTKAGMRMEYGATADSRIMGNSGTAVHGWRLNRAQDPNGNYILYRYITLDGENLLSSIDYTGNSTAGIAPYNRILFQYAERSDKNEVFSGGTGDGPRTARVLETINVECEGTVMKTYRFNYALRDIDRTYLREVSETGTDGVQRFNTTVFKYGDTNAAEDHLTQETSDLFTSTQQHLFAGDFDGDGDSDLLASEYTAGEGGGFIYHTHLRLYRRTAANVLEESWDRPLEVNLQHVDQQQSFLGGLIGSVFGGAVGSISVPQNYTSNLSNDFDGDGREDIVLTDVETQGNSFRFRKLRFLMSRSNDASIFTPEPQEWYGPPTMQIENQTYTYDYVYPSTFNYRLSGDFNGDGLSDILLILSNGSAYQTFLYSPFAGIVGQEVYFEGGAQSNLMTTSLMSIDVDGDGKHEILSRPGDLSLYQGARIFKFSMAPYANFWKVYESTGFPQSTDWLHPGDFNGDGKTDFLYRNGSFANAPWYIKYAKGLVSGDLTFTDPIPFTGFNETVGSHLDNNDNLKVADFNGDGFSDICHTYRIMIDEEVEISRLDLFYSRGARCDFFERQLDYDGVLTSASSIATDLNGDGRADIINSPPFSTLDMLFLDMDGHERALEKVVDGMNATTTFAYVYASQSDEVLDVDGFDYPKGVCKIPLEVTQNMTIPDGLGGTNTTLFGYAKTTVDRRGIGLLGFQERHAVNPVANTWNVTGAVPHEEYAKLLPANEATYRFDDPDEPISHAVHTYGCLPMGDAQYRRHLTKHLATTTSNGLADTWTSVVNTWDDANGNVTNTVTNVFDQEITTTSSPTWVAAGPSAVLSRPERITVAQQRTGSAAVSRTTRYTYDQATGNVMSVTEFLGEPGDVRTTYAYNNTGTVRTKAVSALSVPTSQWPSEEYRYEPKHRFARESIRKWWTGGSYTDVVTVTQTDPRWGKPRTVRTADEMNTAFRYDAFGRLEQTDLPYPTGGQTPGTVTESRAWALNGLEYWQTTVQDPSGPDRTTFHDLLGRTVRTVTEGFGQDELHSSVGYDQRGNVALETTPHESGEAFLTINHQFDGLNRPMQDNNPLSGNTTYGYEYAAGELTRTVTGPGGWNSVTTDAAGRTVRGADDGGQLRYTYDSRANLLSVRHGSDLVAKNTYDLYGRQTSLWAPGAGTTQYIYNAFGKLTWQKDANNNEVTLEYDNLGRLTRRYAPEGNTQYAYWNLNGRINDNPMFVIGPAVTRSYGYDNYNRLNQATSIINGQTYTTSFQNDPFGRVTKTSYPSGLEVHSEYDGTGALSYRYWSGGGLFWAEDVNGLGQCVGYELADGQAVQRTYHHGFLTGIQAPGVQELSMAYDYGTGNMTSRRDDLVDRREIFTYDDLNRLTGALVSTVQVPEVISDNEYAYDGAVGSHTRGGLTMRSDIGQLPFENRVSAAKNINYPTPYDQPPFVISQATQKITYTPFLKTATINEEVGTDLYHLTYTYGPEHERVRSLLTKNNIDHTERIYLGEYEKQFQNGTTQEIHYIPGGTGLAAIIVKTGESWRAYAVYTDHLGSPVTIRDASDGSIVARQSFDPWGRRRDPDTWTYDNLPELPTWLYRGYTGHEHADPFSLINMNGRMYDPNTGRMMSADPYVNGSSATQAFNRYSYASNNPLMYSDPSGEIIQLVIAGLIGGAVNWLANGATFDAQGLGYFGIGFLAGALCAGIGNGVGVAIQGGCFGSGFMYSSTAAFGGGFIGGASGGFSSGMVTGIGNSILGGEDFATSMCNGFKSGLFQGATAGLISGGIAGLNNRHFLTGQMNFADLQAQFVPLAQQEICDVYGDAVGDNTEIICRRNIKPFTPGYTHEGSSLGYDSYGCERFSAKSEFSEHAMRSFMRGGRQGWATVIHEGRHGSDLVTGMQSTLRDQIATDVTQAPLHLRLRDLCEFRAYSTQWMMTGTQQSRYLYYLRGFSNSPNGSRWLPFGGLTF